MKIKVSEATNEVLNYLVAQIEGHQSRCAWMVKDGWRQWQSYEAAWGNPIPDYCGDPSHGHPIIEREHFDVAFEGGTWFAYESEGDNCDPCTGTTLLIAAMRCFVASRLGDEVEVPEELL